MRMFTAGLLILNILHLFFAFAFAKGAGLANNTIYPFALPHLALVFIVASLLVVAIRKRNQLAVTLAGAICIGLSGTLLTANYALSRWPGGDDAGGIGWFIFVGGFSLANCVAAVILCVIAITTAVRKRRSLER